MLIKLRKPSKKRRSFKAKLYGSEYCGSMC